MGVSTDGQLNYGICFEEEFKFPWGDDMEEWWKEVNGFKNPHPIPFDERGEWKNGVKDEKAYELWHDARYKWEEENPLLIKIVIHCSYDCPMHIMTLPDTGYENSRGCPVKIDVEKLTLFDREKAKTIISDFCNKYGIKSDFEFDWWLTSLWG